MPVLNKNHLAVKFRQNWQARFPIMDNANCPNLDDSLTSLGWLQNLNIMKITSPTPPASPPPQNDCPGTRDMMKVNNTTTIHISTDPPKIERNNYIDVSQTSLAALDIDYKTNPYVKPPFSYATLICMAMKETKKTKITLSSIYNWITENFMYYRMADPSWQNSIRHNLSLNKCFQKVPRRKDEPGKGGFWRINPEYSDMFVNGIFKKRRSSARENIQPLKKIKLELDDDSLESQCRFNSHHKKQMIQEIGINDIKGDFSWNSLLNQDISVGGVTIKAEDIINGSNEKMLSEPASPIMAMSPPDSDNTSDSGLDDLWRTDLSNDFSNDSPLDLSTNTCPLDLTINGVGLKAPDWWSESMDKNMLKAELQSVGNRSGLHTPIGLGLDDSCDDSHPWAENKLDLIEEAISSFDMDNLFDIDTLPNLPSL